MTNACSLYFKRCDQARQNKLKETSEEDTLTHQEFLEHMSIQLIWPEESYNAYYSHYYSSFSFIPSGAAAAKRSTRSSAAKINANKGHKNKHSASNEAVEILSNRVTTFCDLSLKKVFLHRLDGKSHPYVTSKLWIPWQYCMWHHHMLYPSAGKQERILYALSKEWKGTTMAPCYVLSGMWSYALTASETSMVSIPLTTLNFKNLFLKHIC